MTKIGTITLPLSSNNYGGIIQAYALQKKISDLGVETMLLDRRINKSLKNILIIGIYKIFYPKYLKVHEDINIEFRNFIKKHIKTSPTFSSYSKLAEYIKINQINTLVTGSDQVWRTKYSKTMYKDLFLDFKGVRKFSYAASLGVDYWEDQEKKTTVNELLKDFSGISVREQSVINLFKEEFDLEVDQHVDPTMLLSKEDYKKDLNLVERNDVELLTYVLDIKNDKEDFINSFAKHHGLKRKKIGVKNKITRSTYKNFFNTKHDSIYEWLTSFMSAKFIIADSFHGVVFSILFNVPFIAIGNKSRGLSRFISILTMFNLTDRLITDYSEEHFKLFDNKIDFDAVNKVLNEERGRANNYIKTFIK